MNRTNLLICLMCFLNACMSVTKDKHSEIITLLTPEHPMTSGIHDTRSTQSQLLDNDGNLYIAYWDVPKDGKVKFKEVEKSCQNSIRKDRIFLNALSIHDFDISDIRPSLYVPFVRCIFNHDYHLIDKEGFSPDSYNLSFYRSHTTTSNYLPVGTTYNIVKKGSKYIGVYNDVVACEESILNQGDGVEDGFTNYTISVSIEKYVADLKKCMVQKSYIVKNINPLFKYK